MNLLIKNANIIDCYTNIKGDIYIENGLINTIGKNIIKDNVSVIDANGLTLIPAFIDTHSHFRDPGLTYKEDLESGSKAALKGGYTGVCLMANTSPTCSTPEVLNYVRNKSLDLKLIDIQQCISITKNFDGKTLDHLNEFDDDLNVKVISDDGIGVMDSLVMLGAMKKAKKNNWVIMSHAEDKYFSKIDMRIAENMMTLRDLYLAKETGARLHMAHVSTKEAIQYIEEAKRDYDNITCEVTPHHIFLTNDICNYRVNPPIRNFKDVESIHKAIKNGIVDCIGTDHAPHTEKDKKNGSPGMVGLETAFPICYTSLVVNKIITLNKLSEMMSKNPSKLLGMNKGTISIGKDADLVLVDLNKKIRVNADEFLSKGKNTPFNNMEFYGEILMTIKSGQVLYSKGE